MLIMKKFIMSFLVSSVIDLNIISPHLRQCGTKEAGAGSSMLFEYKYSLKCSPIYKMKYPSG